MLGCLTKARTTTLRKLPLFQQTQIRLATNARAPNENELTEALLRIQKKVAKEKIPWFLSQMPPAYFRAIGPEEQLQHINAITALSYAEQPSVLLHSPDHKVYSFIRSVKNYPGLLATTIRSLPQEVDGASLARVKIFTTLDDTYSMDIFRFGKQEAFTGKNTEEQEAETTILKLCKDIQDGKYKNFKDYPQPAPYFEPDEVKKFLRCCNSMYVKFSNERRIASQIALYKRVQGTEGVAIEIEHGWETRQHKLAGGNAPQAMITIAAANVLPKTFLQKAATYCGLKGLKILRAHMDTVKDEGNGHVAMTRILVSPSDMSQYKDLNWSEIDTQMRYLKWCDDRILRFWSRHPEIGLDAAEIIIAYGHMLHGVLSRIDSHAYSLPLIFELLEHHQSLPLSKKIANLFLNRFNPSPNNELSNNETFQKEVDKIRGEIRRYVENEENILVLNKFLDAVCGTLRTNKYLRTRYALALRLDPNILGYGSVGKETPFGAFFVNGRRFKAFHVRFRDIARGGLRVVAPLTEEAHWLESSRQYTEAYNLAFAQQLKNKDIPEGGSKAVLLVQPNERMMYPKHRDFIMRKSVKAFTDALLDLNTTDPNVKTNISDYYGKDELIYLGPDENIIPQDIVWMTKRAAYRKYPIPRAFISSKPDSGINHKVYGVTSEGVAVFCDVALRTMGIDPKKQQFTVKITGGTDGDVAGNMLKILFREYGENARVVGICDHTAVLEDPDGLSSQELLRLFNESLPLEFYNEKCIRAKGVFAKIMEDVHGQRKTNAEAIRLRNSMHNRVKSDLFVPAGGRPNTINDNNWKSYLDENNKPSSPLIVEGANLFITPEARQMLFEHGKVIIAKDSSANKCGVMCSSYEIISNMLLEKEEFMQIKEELIQDVLKKLKQLAKVEAELLFREYKKNPNIALPKYSERVSRAIIRLHDAIVENFDELQKQDKNALQSLIQEHLPHKLAEIALNRVEKDVPEPYIKSIIAATLASKIVYREGLQFTESQPDNMLSSLAMKYLKQEKKVLRLVKSVKASGHPDADVISDLLMRGGVRAGIESL